jgi:hypothetical protein
MKEEKPHRIAEKRPLNGGLFRTLSKPSEGSGRPVAGEVDGGEDLIEATQAQAAGLDREVAHSVILILRGD